MEETMNRRDFLAETAATATAVGVQAATAATEAPFGATGVPVTATGALPLGPLSGSRYPDPHIGVLDKRFKGSPGTGAVERLATGFRWAEGPVYFPAGRYVLFSDIPNTHYAPVRRRQHRAIADYDEALRLDPKYAFAFNNRGNVYKAKGDLDRAIADYNEALRLDPKHAVDFNSRGNAYQDKGDLDRAIVDYNEVIRLDPKYAVAFFNRGIAYRAKDDPDRAIADYNEARPSGSIRNMPSPSTAAATHTKTRVTPTAPSPTTTRRGHRARSEICRRLQQRIDYIKSLSIGIRWGPGPAPS
jgi:hypothetical protein